MSRSLGGRLVTSRSPMWIVPADGTSRPAIMLSSVDLPQPEDPTRIRNSPASTSMSIPLRISTWPKVLRTLAIVSAPISSSLHRAGRQAAHEILASNNVDEQGRQRGDQCRGHVHVVFLDRTGRVREIVQADGDRLRIRAREDDAIQEIVPDVRELPDQRHDQD